MGLLDGKKALIFGVANDHSIAWGIAKALHDEGATLGFSSIESLIDRRVKPLADSIGATFVEPCDVQSDEDIARVMAAWKAAHGEIDILVATPGRLADLVTLPGVGRKTANVVLGNAFDVPGITVDTHFARLVRRFKWSDETDPVKVEHAVGALFPKRDWTMLSHHLIWHGRRVCHAKKPACGACAVARWCPSFGAGPTDPDTAAALVKTQGPA